MRGRIKNLLLTLSSFLFANTNINLNTYNVFTMILPAHFLYCHRQLLVETNNLKRQLSNKNGFQIQNRYELIKPADEP